MALLDRAEFKRMSQERFPLSDDLAENFLAKHKLGKLESQRLMGGNFTNSVFECRTTVGDCFILKIQYRVGNLSLEADRDVTQLLEEALTVTSLCLLDNDCDVIPFPTLILSKLEGELAETIFEHSTHQARIRLSRILGEILATIHAVPVSEGQVPSKPLFSLNGWREKVGDGLLKDEELRSVIDGIDRGFYAQLQGLLDQIPDLHFDEKLCLVWGDPKFHNFLVQEDGDDIQLCGVFDFQTAGLGNPIFDALSLEGNFERNQSDGLYQNAAYVEACCDAYAECGMQWPQISEIERVVRDVILKANGARWWWDAARVLPPFVPKTLAGVIDGLEWLKKNVE
jgi:Ser/Thr protein kinase RdoA (MazF antagonist)